mgnify:CR=1 FL=1
MGDGCLGEVIVALFEGEYLCLGGISLVVEIWRDGECLHR